jgi:hypothetical protein
LTISPFILFEIYPFYNKCSKNKIGELLHVLNTYIKSF